MANSHETLTGLFTDIAGAIRSKTGGSGAIVADRFPEAIAAIDTQENLDAELSAQDSLIAQINTALAGKVVVNPPVQVAFTPSAVLQEIVIPELIGKSNCILLGEVKNGTSYTPSGAMVIGGIYCKDGVCTLTYHSAEKSGNTYTGNVSTIEVAGTFDSATGKIKTSTAYFVHHFIYNGFAW